MMEDDAYRPCKHCGYDCYISGNSGATPAKLTQELFVICIQRIFLAFDMPLICVLVTLPTSALWCASNFPSWKECSTFCRASLKRQGSLKKHKKNSNANNKSKPSCGNSNTKHSYLRGQQDLHLWVRSIILLHLSRQSLCELCGREMVLKTRNMDCKQEFNIPTEERMERDIQYATIEFFSLFIWVWMWVYVNPNCNIYTVPLA